MAGDTVELNARFFFGDDGAYVRLTDMMTLLRALRSDENGKKYVLDLDAIEVSLYRAAETARNSQ